jgi:hypothetical protein
VSAVSAADTTCAAEPEWPNYHRHLCCSWLLHVGNAPSLTEVPVFNGIDLHIIYLHEARAESDSHSNGWACLKTPHYHELLTRFSIALTPSKQSRGSVSMFINLAG